MAAEKNFVVLHGSDGASGIDGSVALDEHHSGHVAWRELSIVGARGSCAALCRDETVGTELRREFVDGGWLEAGEDERRFDRLQCGAVLHPGAHCRFVGKWRDG